MNPFIGENAARRHVEWLDTLRTQEGYSWRWCFEVAELGLPVEYRVIDGISDAPATPAEQTEQTA